MIFILHTQLTVAGLNLETGPNALQIVEKELKPEQGVVLILPQLMVEQIVLEKPVRHKPVKKMNVQVGRKLFYSRHVRRPSGAVG